MGYWEHFAHESDIGVRGLGASSNEAFEQAALALTAIVTDPAGVNPVDKVELGCEAPDMELLLADWLNAVIYEMATRHMLFSRYQVRIEHGRLDGAAWGETVELSRHRPAVEPKGATYTALMVSQQKDGSWLAQCVVDV